MRSGTVYRVVRVRTDVSENISPPSSWFLRVMCFQSCVTVESLLIGLPVEGYYAGSKKTAFWDALTAVINYRCVLGLCTL
jgi:hypothetical protein